MKKGRVLNLRFLSNATFFAAKNKILIVTAVFLVIGLFSGVFSFKRFDLLFNFIENYVERFISIRNSSKFIEVFINSFLESFGLIFLLFYFGTSMFGIIFIPFLITFRGYLYGATAAFLYWKYAINGVALNAVLILPTAIFFIIAFLSVSLEDFIFLASKLSLSSNKFLYSSYFLLKIICIFTSKSR